MIHEKIVVVSLMIGIMMKRLNESIDYAESHCMFGCIYVNAQFKQEERIEIDLYLNVDRVKIVKLNLMSMDSEN